MQAAANELVAAEAERSKWQSSIDEVHLPTCLLCSCSNKCTGHNPLPTSLRQEVCFTAVPGRYWLQTGMDHVCLGLCCSCNQLEILLSCLANVICKLCVWGRFALPCLHCLRGWPCIEHAIHVTLTLWNTSPSPCCHTHTLVTMLKSDCSC